MKKHLYFLLWVCGLLTLVNAPATATSKPVILPCVYGHSLCGKTLAEVTLLGSHNSFSNADEHWQAPNQTHGLVKQMEDGVRALSLDVYDLDGVPTLCHSFCNMGKETLLSGFQKLVAFLKSHSREVFTIGFESYIAPQRILDVAKEAGLEPYLHQQQPGKPWPTLSQMINSGHRVVIFTGKDGGTVPFIHNYDDFVHSNGWGYKSLAALDCHPAGQTTPPTANQLLSLNHQYVNAFGLPEIKLSAKANARQAILDHAQKCAAELHHPVNIMELDNYDVGDGLATVLEMNGIVAPPKTNADP